ncbi:uncharacterized protein K02A2.6-like [Ostrea edulis]|uniref:uncharacterized protein K02A2.6-like n=1 Tax=Ostrea edulis TaxID=37623 RepID=UPI0024AEE2BD|nr:uncharacterized protein K02A2.6-like [Ostrea edulis]
MLLCMEPKTTRYVKKCINEGSDLTLEKTVKFARTSELSKQQVQSMEDKSVNGISVKANRGQTQYRKQIFHAKNESESTKQKVKDCRNCGKTHDYKQCPAYGETCRKCGKLNHFAVKCRSSNKRTGASSKKTNKVKTMHAVDTSEEEFFIGTVDVGSIRVYYRTRMPTRHLHHQGRKRCAAGYTSPRKIPLALKDKVKDELDRMEREGVIVKQREPTKWVNSMVTVTKPNGKIRICVDPRDLNRAILREHFPLKTVEEVAAMMPGAKVYSKLDATSGFWQTKIDEESSKLCTFNSSFERYRFIRMPFGIKSAPEVFQRAISEMAQDLDGTEAIIDDIIWGTTEEEHNRRLKAVLERARQFNLKLSADKCEMRRSELTYVGQIY